MSDPVRDASSMFVMHVALQGCLRGEKVEYGLNADTGGHIRYLLELVRAASSHPAIGRTEIVTRAFSGPRFDPCYAAPCESIDGRTRIVRLATGTPVYLTKEDLWREHEDFVEALILHIRTLDRAPDLLHAHYADAGLVASAVKARLGIPFLFTAHSLGQVKRDSLPAGCQETAGIERRIAIEETVIGDADGIIASSRDEAEVQFAFYASYMPGRLRIIPPGSDVESFTAAVVSDSVRDTLARFLRRPELPVILAIARPVMRKNLQALVHAYGRSAALRARANLVIVAGNRDDLGGLEPELCRTIAELLHLIDRYDLYGSVAYPKQHHPADIPAFYAHARERRGVFVNAALNEPFGLTLVEAAAAGLPVVATNHGGAADIVRGARNGILVDPHCTQDIADAIGTLLDDPAAWDRCSLSGMAAARQYDWARHVTLYADFAGRLAKPRSAPALRDAFTLLVSDIDDTLIGCSDSVRSFKAWHAGQNDLMFGIATGRSFHSALSILTQSDAPCPEVLISSAGSEIHLLADNRVIYRRDEDWTRQIGIGWDRDAIIALLGSQDGLVPQARLEQRQYKLSYFTHRDADIVFRVRDLLADAGHACSVIQSHHRYLDILPLGVSKGAAIEHVRQKLGLGRDHVMVAGDSGNDVEMLRSVPHAIIVANYSDDLATRPDLSHSYIARRRFASGVMEGVEHFNALRAAR